MAVEISRVTGSQLRIGQSCRYPDGSLPDEFSIPGENEGREIFCDPVVEEIPPYSINNI